MATPLASLLSTPHRSAMETSRLAQLVELLLRLPPPPSAARHFPKWTSLQNALGEAVAAECDEETLEERILELYAHLHMHEATYTRRERMRMDASGGYWAHAGGLAPILKAGPHLHPTSVSMDLGAGNGLQGLLFQVLDPHHRTIQVEISSSMVSIGRELQAWIGIANEKVQWRVADVLDCSVLGVDFLYLYRPVRPEGPGRVFYRRLATELASSPHDVVVFSIADCLWHELSNAFELFYCDGHLSCMRKRRG